jgi:hypothetical protein
MLALFIIVFVFAVCLTFFTLFTIAEDIKQKSDRIYYTLGMAFGLWVMTMPALLAPGLQQVVKYPQYQTISNTITNGVPLFCSGATTLTTCGTTTETSNTIITYAAYNVTTLQDHYVPPSLFYSYFWIWVFLVSIHGLWNLLLWWGRFKNKSANVLLDKEDF